MARTFNNITTALTNYFSKKGAAYSRGPKTVQDAQQLLRKWEKRILDGIRSRTQGSPQGKFTPSVYNTSISAPTNAQDGHAFSAIRYDYVPSKPSSFIENLNKRGALKHYPRLSQGWNVPMIYEYGYSSRKWPLVMVPALRDLEGTHAMQDTVNALRPMAQIEGVKIMFVP